MNRALEIAKFCIQDHISRMEDGLRALYRLRDTAGIAEVAAAVDAYREALRTLVQAAEIDNEEDPTMSTEVEKNEILRENVLSTTELSARLGITVSAYFLEEIGIDPVQKAQAGRAVYWRTSDFPKICGMLSRYFGDMAQGG